MTPAFLQIRPPCEPENQNSFVFQVNGVVIISTVIVSFHPIFITKVDRAYRLSCFYVEGTKKVQQQLDIASVRSPRIEDLPSPIFTRS
ncbi:hypothetical protein COOONC_14860 [Cooperia oncophora]